MCDDMDFDVSSDVSDSSFDIADDVSSDFNDVGAEDISIDDIGDDAFDIDDSFTDIDDFVDFDDSFEMDDISDDFEINTSEEIETLDFDTDIETLDSDDTLDEVETLELDDSDLDIAEEFETTQETEELSIDDGDFDFDDKSDEIEMLDISDDFSDDIFEEAIDELDINDNDIDNAETDLYNEFSDEKIDNETINESIDLVDETMDNDNYEATPISEIPIVDEYGNVDTLENVMNDNEELEEMHMEVDSYEAIPNEYSDSEVEESVVEPYEATPISDLPISQEYENDESLDETEELSDAEFEESFEEFNNEDLEQALRDDAVDNAPLTDSVYEDDSEFTDNNEHEIPHMTDEELEEFINWEHQHENGNYDLINDIMNDDSLTDDQKEFMTQQLLDEIQEGENEVPEYGQRVKGLTYDGRDIITKPDEFENNIEQTEQIDDVFNGELSESDIDAVYEGLENYDFQGVDCFEDIERLDSSLESFTNENWEQLSLDEQKEKMTDLADYIIDVTGLENPPRIEFYNNPQEGDYGGFDRTTNTLSINEHMLYQNDEAADTVAHELWHALQYQRASNPRTKLDAMYAENFNDYISPNEDFEGYQSQILESEARVFAQQIKDRLHSY